ncbi:hypothetical protein [Luteococcus sp. OSA5]|uniref:hypothetical protein n=1 Tax=Luteococcus sp. OSA5 TaxID=3401630 RepID=UPI003B4353F5
MEFLVCAAIFIAVVMLVEPVGTILAMGLLMLLVPSLNAGLSAWFIGEVPDGMQGRLTSAVSLLAMAAAPVAQGYAGLSLQRWGRATAMAPGVAAMVVSALVVLTVPTLRRIPRASEFSDPANMNRI